MKRKLTTLLVPLFAAGLIAAGCGSDDDSGSDTSAANTQTETQSQATTTEKSSGGGGGGQQLKIDADPSGQLKFDKKALSAKKGKVTISLTNAAPVPHDVAIERAGRELAKSKTVSGGGSATATADLKPGRYTFFCAVPGHCEAGMEGTLTVE